MVVVYYSITGNVQRFVNELGAKGIRITSAKMPEMDEPFILITPTYTDRIPAPVERFLDSLPSTDSCIGVIGSGNRNFGADYCAAAKNIEEQYGIPFLYSLELFGLPRDIEAVQDIIANQLCQK